MVANKMTGDKGILFTATYVTKFDDMEKRLTDPVQNYLYMSRKIERYYILQKQKKLNN